MCYILYIQHGGHGVLAKRRWASLIEANRIECGLIGTMGLHEFGSPMLCDLSRPFRTTDDLIVLHVLISQRTGSELDGQSLVKRSEILVEYIYLVSWLHCARLKSGS